MKNALKSPRISGKMIEGLLWGTILGSLVPRTKKLTKKEVKDFRKNTQKKYANLMEANSDMEKISKADIVFEKHAGRGTVFRDWV